MARSMRQTATGACRQELRQRVAADKDCGEAAWTQLSTRPQGMAKTPLTSISTGVAGDALHGPDVVPWSKWSATGALLL